MSEKKKGKAVNRETIFGNVEKIKKGVDSLKAVIPLAFNQADVRTRFSFPALPEVNWGGLGRHCISLLDEIGSSVNAIQDEVIPGGETGQAK